MSLNKRCVIDGIVGTILLVTAVPLYGQETVNGDDATMAKDAAWAWLGRLVGRWEGTGRGTPGESKLERSYEVVLQGQYMYGTNKSVFAAQEKNLQGEVHEDWAMYSYDVARKKIVIREFNSEGYVNRYVLTSMKDDGDTLVFETEASENAPPKLKARITYRILGRDAFAETFELAFDGVHFTPCVETSLRRKK